MNFNYLFFLRDTIRNSIQYEHLLFDITIYTNIYDDIAIALRIYGV